jgi:hypothetical protein
VILRLGQVLILAANIIGVANSQQPSNAAANSNNASDTQKAIDQLIEQNGRLEQQNRDLMQQNRDLMQQINSLRPSVAKQDGTVQPAPAQNPSSSAQPSPSGAPQPPATQPSGQPSGQDQSKGDDTTLLPQASDGRPGVFGEFNPGRGFTVAKGEYGELNLSGYLAVRYLNQLPPDQSARDHLGRPLAVEPRNDFQFHRVMLFSQGWLFTPKFQYSTFVWTVQDTNQVAVGGALYYNFGKYMTLGAGWNAYPGTQSLQGSHPYWVS